MVSSAAEVRDAFQTGNGVGGKDTERGQRRAVSGSDEVVQLDRDPKNRLTSHIHTEKFTIAVEYSLSFESMFQKPNQ